MEAAKKWRIVRIVLLILALIAIPLFVWLQQSLIAQDQVGKDADDTAAVITQEIPARPQILATNDAYVRYVQNLTAGDIKRVDESRIHDAENIDWNEDVLAAIEFSLLSSRTFTGASIESIDGVRSYVIDIIDVAKGCMVTQDNVLHVAFVKQTSNDANLPVILRTTPNTASCDL